MSSSLPCRLTPSLSRCLLFVFVCLFLFVCLFVCFLQVRWQEYFETYGRDLTMVINEVELTTLLRSSIPDLYRGAMWQLLSGAGAKQLVAPGYYALLRERHQDHTSLATRDIAKDLFRSFPEHQLFSGENELSDKELANMREVLMSTCALLCVCVLFAFTHA
jgi:hypothetical protein